MINIEDLTIGQVKQLQGLVGAASPSEGLNCFLGQKVIIRTYSAGVHFGTLKEKSGNEVVLTNARRLWLWHAKEGICTHGVARFGIDADKSRIGAPIDFLWLQAIEIIPCTYIAAELIEGAKYAQAQ